jgi:hypothetical protein
MREESGRERIGRGLGLSGWNYVVVGQDGFYRDEGPGYPAADIHDFRVDKVGKRLMLQFSEGVVDGDCEVPRMEGYSYVSPEEMQERGFINKVVDVELMVKGYASVIEERDMEIRALRNIEADLRARVQELENKVLELYGKKFTEVGGLTNKEILKTGLTIEELKSHMDKMMLQFSEEQSGGSEEGIVCTEEESGDDCSGEECEDGGDDCE